MKYLLLVKIQCNIYKIRTTSSLNKIIKKKGIKSLNPKPHYFHRNEALHPGLEALSLWMAKLI